MPPIFWRHVSRVESQAGKVLCNDEIKIDEALIILDKIRVRFWVEDF